MEHKGKTALVTGAGQGIGRATAERLARAGANVYVQDIDAEALDETVSRLADFEVGVVASVGDLRESALPEKMIQESVDAFGGLDIVVNNAGYIWNGAMHNHSEAQWQAMLEIHATVPFRLLQAFAGWMRPTVKQEMLDSGVGVSRRVVNISSVSGTQGSATQVAYSAGKAAVIGLTKTLAKEWGRYNCNVNAVAFGHIETRLTQSYEDDVPEIEVGGRSFRVGLSSRQRAGISSSVPLGRPGTVEEAAGAIYLLTLPEAGYITGEVITCSGGI